MSTPAANGLNIAQQEAVNYMHGPCLVLAGAGSGKTRVITHKIGRLIQTGLEPKRIFAITFTNKAATEMRERARSLIGKAAKEVVICTFHALGVRMMRQDGEALGLKPTFSILDTDDVTSILKDAGGSTDAATARTWQWTISRWKNMGLNAAEAEAQAGDDSEKITARIMARYEERLTAYQSVDFDDLISLPLKLLQNHEHVRAKWQKLAGHVLVDEYQDTNATQYEFLKLLAGGVLGTAAKDARFTVVGDDDQSIYGWRGATLDNLKKLPLDFPTLKVIKLEQNYRSTGAILRAANNVIGPNPKLFPKNLWSALGEGEPVRVVDADSEEHEAERTVARIQSLRALGGVPQRGVAAERVRPEQGTAPPGGRVPLDVGVRGVQVIAAAPGRPKQGTAPSGGSAAHEVASVGAISQKVTIRPLAGTRPRGASDELDKAAEHELVNDPKERAEHVMLIDLARNDIGRIAKIGSVKVTEAFDVERYSHVMHIVSNVEGILLDGMTNMDVLKATFPAGTLTGAPKVHAMEIIDQLEPTKRGLYGGACGYLSYAGDMDVAIAIRTGIIKDQMLYVQAAAGVVADSIPEQEWRETEAKARALLRASELVEEGLE